MSASETSRQRRAMAPQPAPARSTGPQPSLARSRAPQRATSQAPAPRPLYLRGSGPPVFAFLHPGAHPRKRTAVLMCPPFGWEDMCCYRIRRDWAQELAQAGHTTLRIDLPGSGDSAGAPTDPGQLGAWTRSVEEASRWLLSTSGAERVAAIGIGLGGLVACRAAQAGAPIAELVLWSVPARGRTLLRELRAFSAFEVANNPGEEEPTPEGRPAEDGTLATNGYLMSAETVAELRNLDLAQAQPADTAEARAATARGWRLRRALVLGRDGMEVKRDLPDLLRSAGAEVQVADGPGYGAMMQEPQDARTPVEVIERVGSWLREGEREPGRAREPDAGRVAAIATGATGADEAGAGTSGVSAAGEAGAGTSDASGAGEASAGTSGASGASGATPIEVGEEEQMTIECAGVEVRERPVFLQGPDGPMFGVLSEPVGERSELTAVLLNAGPQRRIGPNRMWVEIARRWAARGVPALRLDCAGIGDSDGDPSVLARVTEFYRPTYAEQARAAVQALAQRGLPQRFVLLGLCAGSYWSVQTALADERVARVIMLNPRTLVFDEWRHARRRTRQLREKALRAQTWRKVLAGEIKVSAHLETGRTLLQRAVSAPARVRARLTAPRGKAGSGSGSGSGPASAPAPAGGPAEVGAARDPIEELFDELRDRGQRGLLLFTGKEVLRGELTDKGVLERMDRWPNLELAIKGTSADTHTLTPVWLQRQVHELVDRVLEEELERLPERTAASPA